MDKLNNSKKIKYICETYQDKRFYFRQEFLKEENRWGEPRRISEDTFLKRKNDGFPVEYRRIEQLPYSIRCELADIDSLIDLALDTRDEEWYRELLEKRNAILE